MNRKFKFSFLTRVLSLGLVCALFVASASGCSFPTANEEETIVEASTEETTEEVATTEETTQETTEETTEEETQPLPTEPIQFMFFGVDTVGYTEVDKGRSDILKVVQINPQDKTIKFVSILRDSKVPIEGHDPQKINAAFMYGGAQLAIDTVNKNFNLNIQDYVMLNFSGMVELIDYIDGVWCNITEEEAEIINEQSDGDYVGDGRNHYCQPVSAGWARLDGTQALAYSRIRYIDSDYYRSKRQFNVLTSIIWELGEMSTLEQLDIIFKFYDIVETTLDVDDVITWTRMDLQDYTVSSFIVPDYEIDEDLFGGIDETESWVYIYDIDAAAANIAEFLKTEEPKAETETEAEIESSESEGETDEAGDESEEETETVTGESES